MQLFDSLSSRIKCFVKEFLKNIKNKLFILDVGSYCFEKILNSDISIKFLNNIKRKYTDKYLILICNSIREDGVFNSLIEKIQKNLIILLKEQHNG